MAPAPHRHAAESADAAQVIVAARAAQGGDEKRGYVQSIFSDIAPRYDLLNRLLSFSIDRRWRRRALGQLGWERAPDGVYLDVCAGTLDIGAMLVGTSGFRGMVIGADFAEPMLRAGAGKASPRRVAPVTADALQLPVRDASVDGAIVAFGIRNVANLDAGLQEVRRVLRPGGRFVILEFTTPRSRIIRAFYHLYFHHVLPFVGGVVSGHRTAYAYLPKSVANFPEEAELARRMRDAGYRDVRFNRLTFGIAAVHVGTR